MLVEQTMFQIMVAMVMTILIPALTYAVQVNFAEVPHRQHRQHSPLSHDESLVDLSPTKLLDDGFAKTSMEAVDNIKIAPSLNGLDPSTLKHGLEETLRTIHNHHNQLRNQKHGKKNHKKERTLKSTNTGSKHDHTLREDHENLRDKEQVRIHDKGHDRRNGKSHHLTRTSTGHKDPQKHTSKASSRRSESSGGRLDVHLRRAKRDGPAAPLPPSLPIPTHQSPPGMKNEPWREVPPPANFPYINEGPHDTMLKTQTTSMPTTSSTNQSGDAPGSAVSHLYGRTRWTLAVAVLLPLAIHVLF